MLLFNFGHSSTKPAIVDLNGFGIYGLQNLNDRQSVKIMFLTEVWSDSSHLSGYIVKGAAVGNTVFGVFAGGSTNTATVSQSNKFIFSTASVSYGTSLSVAREKLGAAGNTTDGIFGGGITWAPGSTRTNVIDKYNYDSNVVSSGTSLTGNAEGQTATGNNTFGLFRSFDDSSRKYQYASNAIVSGVNLSLTTTNIVAFGNKTFGIFGGGATTQYAPGKTSKYIYSSDVVLTSSASNIPSLNTGQASLGATGNAVKGIIAGDSNNSRVAVRYNYSTDTATGITRLNRIFYGGSGISSTPGGF